MLVLKRATIFFLSNAICFHVMVFCYDFADQVAFTLYINHSVCQCVWAAYFFFSKLLKLSVKTPVITEYILLQHAMYVN